MDQRAVEQRGVEQRGVEREKGTSHLISSFLNILSCCDNVFILIFGSRLQSNHFVPLHDPSKIITSGFFILWESQRSARIMNLHTVQYLECGPIEQV